MDRKLRELQRLAKTGDTSAEERYLFEYCRSHNSFDSLKILHVLQYPAAINAITNNWSIFLSPEEHKQLSELSDNKRLQYLPRICNLDQCLLISKVICGYAIGAWKTYIQAMTTTRLRYGPSIEEAQAVFMSPEQINLYYELFDTWETYVIDGNRFQVAQIVDSLERITADLDLIKIFGLNSVNNLMSNVVTLCLKLLKFKLRILYQIPPKFPAQEILQAVNTAPGVTALIVNQAKVLLSRCERYDSMLTEDQAEVILWGLVKQNLVDSILREKFEY